MSENISVKIPSVKHHLTVKDHYGSLDGLKALAAIGIVMMHIKANTSYEVTGYFYNQVIPSFTNFVFLFMTISAFGLCCGYYEKIFKNEITVTAFYAKRFKKILPFFALLVLVDTALSPSISTFWQAFADLTLMFGFLPNAGSITVIGVGWFLGLVFVFYICFPFFCFLIGNRKRAWCAFIISVIYNFACTYYFEVGRSNILYSACFFLAGGLIYLYRYEIAGFNQWVLLGVICIAIALYFAVYSGTMAYLLLSILFVGYAVSASNWGGKILDNSFVGFVSGISMEIYLSHMLIYRIADMFRVTKMFGNGVIQYIVTVVIVLLGSVIFALLAKKIIQKAKEQMAKLHILKRLDN
jgi:peptidoglycan/LPS O-acetylase OafA/YrhL